MKNQRIEQVLFVYLKLDYFSVPQTSIVFKLKHINEPHRLTRSVTTINMGTDVYCESIPHTALWCHKYSLANQILKMVNKCII